MDSDKQLKLLKSFKTNLSTLNKKKNVNNLNNPEIFEFQLIFFEGSTCTCSTEWHLVLMYDDAHLSIISILLPYRYESLLSYMIKVFSASEDDCKLRNVSASEGIIPNTVICSTLD